MNHAAISVNKRMSAAERREQILDVTQEIVAADGFAAVTMKRMANDAGISRTVIYQQFGDLSATLVALVNREFHKELDVYLRSVTNHPGGGINQFVAVISDLLERVDSNPAAWRLFLMPPEGSPPELHQRLSEGRELVKHFLGESLKAAGQQGASILFQHDFELGVSSILAVAEDLLRQRLEAPENYSHQRLLRQVRTLSAALFPDMA